MLPKFKLNQEVVILYPPKIDGRCNHGVIVGFKAGYTYSVVRALPQFLTDIVIEYYQVAYQDCDTQKYCIDSIFYTDLEAIIIKRKKVVK